MLISAIALILGRPLLPLTVSNGRPGSDCLCSFLSVFFYEFYLPGSAVYAIIIVRCEQSDRILFMQHMVFICYISVPIRDQTVPPRISQSTQTLSSSINSLLPCEWYYPWFTALTNVAFFSGYMYFFEACLKNCRK